QARAGAGVDGGEHAGVAGGVDHAVLDRGPAGDVIDGGERREPADRGERVLPQPSAGAGQIGGELARGGGGNAYLVADRRAGGGKDARRLGDRLVGPQHLAVVGVDRVDLVVGGGEVGARAQHGRRPGERAVGAPLPNLLAVRDRERREIAVAGGD